MLVRRVEPPGGAAWVSVRVKMRSPNGRSLLVTAEHGLGHGGGAMAIIGNEMVLALLRDEEGPLFKDILSGSRWEVIE